MGQINGTLILFKIGEAASEAVLACSTASTLTINQEALPASCKDANQWANSIEGTKSFEVSTSGLYDDAGGNFDVLADLIITGPNEIGFIFGSEGTGATVYKGTVMVSSTALTGDDNAIATYSGTLSGKGALTSEVNGA